MNVVLVVASIESSPLEFYIHLKEQPSPATLRPYIKNYLRDFLIWNPREILETRVKIVWSPLPKSYQDIIQGIPRDEKGCPVCMDEEILERVTYKCSHSFCVKCADKLLKKYKCPLCRQSFLDSKIFYCMLPSPPKCKFCNHESFNLINDVCSMCFLNCVVQMLEQF